MPKKDRVCLFVFCVLLMFFSISSRAGDSFNLSITYNDQVFSLIPRPELGYIVQLQDNAGSISTYNETVQLFNDANIKKIIGFGQHKASIVFSNRPAEDNETIIRTLKSDTRVRFAAPLFTLNDQTVAVIPEIIVRISERADFQSLEELCNALRLTVIKKMEFTSREYLLEVLATDATAVMSAVKRLEGNSLIEWAAPNIAFEPQLAGQFIPNDEYFSKQWDLHNTGQTGGTCNSDVNAPEAWEITTGDPNIVIAILDTGVDINHPDLVNNIVPGYDFIEGDAIPEPGRFWADDAHGTSCAGLAAAQGNNTIGVAGIAWNCKIMPIRILTYDSYIPEAHVATAIRWAAENGADILSNSWGSFIPLKAIQSAISDVTAPGGIGRDGKGCLVFCASGNWENGGSVVYPALYPDVIAVGAVDHDSEVWYYSAGGPELDLVAPSGGILAADYHILGKSFQWTTDIAGTPGFSIFNMDLSILDYSDTMGGTSGACPIAAGIAALVLSVAPNLTNEEVRTILIDSSVDLGQPGFDDSYGHGCVNAFAAVERTLNMISPSEASPDIDN